MYNFNLLVVLLTTGIILLKILWLRTEIHYFKHRINFAMLKTNFIEAVILALQILQVYLFPLPQTEFDGIFVFIGTAMYVTGIIMALWARNTMQQSWGIPGEHAAQQNKLVTSGPFSFSRNPIYLAFILIYVGFCVAIRSWLVILRIPLILYFYISAIREEKLLEKNFGEKYIRYKTKVPRFLFV